MWWPFRRYEYYKVTLNGILGGIKQGPYKTEEEARRAEWPDYVKSVLHVTDEGIVKQRVK
jgi:hypothetical protein